MIAGSLEIQMLANMAELKKQMDQGVGIVKGASEQMQKAADLAGKALGLLGVTLTIGAFTGFIRNAIDSAAALDNLSKRTSVSVKELSSLQLSYKLAGMSNDAMGSSMAKLSQQMSEGNVGLRALGVNARDAAGNLRTPTSVLMELSDKFAAMQDGAGKTALAMEIFGKSGAEMLPMLNGGSEGIREMTAMAEKLGIVIEDETAAKAAQFNDTLDLLKLGVQGVGSRVAVQLLPTLNNLVGSFLETMTSGERLNGVANALAAGMKILYSAGIGVTEVFNTLGKSAGAGAAALIAVLKGNFSEAKGILDQAKTDITAGWDSSATAIRKAWSDESDTTVAAAAQIIKSNNDILAQQKAREEAAKKASAAAGKAAADHAKQIQDAVNVLDGLLAVDSGLSKDFQKNWDALNLAYKEGGKSLEDLQKAQAVLLAQQPAMKKAAEEETAAWKAYREERQKVGEEIQKSAGELEKGNEELRKEIQLIGKSKKEQQEILRARREAVILAKEATVAELERKEALGAADMVQLVALKNEIEQLKERNSLLSLKGVVEQSDQAQQELRNQFQQTMKQAEDWFTSSFLDMINNGKSGWKAMCESLKNSFLTLVVKAIYKALAEPFVVQIIGSFLGVSGENAAALLGGSSSSGGMTSGVLNNLGTLGAGAQAAFGLSAGASTASLIGANAVGAMGGDALGTLIALNGSWAGVGTGAAAAGGATAATGGLMSALSSIPVWGWIAAAVVAAIGWIVGNDDSGTPHSGSIGSYNAETGYQQVQNGTELGDVGIDMGMIYGGEEMAKIPETISKGLVDVLDTMSTTFGRDAGYTVTTGFADDSSKDGAWGGLRIIGPDGQDLVNWDDDRTSKWAPREFANGEEGLEEYLMAVAVDTRKAMMESMDLPTWAKDILGSVSDEDFNLDALQNLVSQIGQIQAVFDGLADTLVGFSNLSSEAMGKLMDASGGIEQLSANASTYYENFYTQEEKVGKQREAINKTLQDLGLEEIDLSAENAREQFRALVEEQLALGDSSAETVAALLALSGAVAQVTITAEDAAEAERERAQAAIEAAEAQKEAALQAMGLSVDSLVSGFLTEVNEGRGASAGAWLADTIAAGFEQAIYGQAIEIIMNSIVDGVITPVVTAAMTGAVVSEAVSDAAIETMVANARAAAEALNILLNDPEFKKAMDVVLGIVKDLGNSIGASIPKMSTYKASTTNLANSYIVATKATDAAAEAAKKLADTMKTLADAIVDEIKRIRGEVAGTGAAGFASMQSQFAIATAQARAGDEEAAKALPGLSKDLLELAKTNMRSSADLKYFQATTAASLQATVEAMAAKFGFDVPAYADGGFHAGGWALVGERGPELAYMPPSHIYTAPQTRELMSGGGNEGWQYVASELAKTNERLRNVERHARKTAEVLEGFEKVGTPVVNHRGTKLEVKEEVAA